jgi:hypothetical protein
MDVCSQFSVLCCTVYGYTEVLRWADRPAKGSYKLCKRIHSFEFNSELELARL